MKRDKMEVAIINTQHSAIAIGHAPTTMGEAT